jgi:hypothetical protein
MSDPLPQQTEQELAPPPTPPQGAPQAAPQGWFQRLTSVLFIIFCFELGLFLLIYPWTDGWSENYFAWIVPGRFLRTWHEFWDNGYMRGGLSGLGLLNLWIALNELFHMFARRHEETLKP